MTGAWGVDLILVCLLLPFTQSGTPTSHHTLSSLRAKRSNPSTSSARGKGDLKNLQIVFNKRSRHQSFSDLFRESCVNRYLCNNNANLWTGLGTRCQKILCTGHRMTGVENIGLVRSVIFSVWLLLVLSKNSVNTSVAAKKMPLIRDIGFAERERETFCLLIFHLSFLIFFC